MNPAYYLSTTSRQDVIRVGKDSITLLPNDFQHHEWSVDTAKLSLRDIHRIHQFCELHEITLNWSVMAERHY